MLVFGVKVSVSAAFVPLTTFVEVIATVAMFVSDELTVTLTLVIAVSVSTTLTTAVLVLVASSRIVLETTPVKLGASFTGVAPMLKVFVTESLPPPVTPPLSFITTVIVFVPMAFVAVRKVNVPFVLMAGAVAKLKFVPDVSVNVHVCEASFVGPLLIPVRKLAFVIVPASSPTSTRFVLTMKAGTSFTAVTVSKKLFVVVNAPSFAIKVIVALPVAFVFGLKVSVSAELVEFNTFVEVIATVTRLVSDELTVTDTLVLAVSVSIAFTTAVLLVVASSRIVLETTPVNVGASFAGVTPMLNVFVTESLPPPVTPPVSFITTVMTFVPMAFVAVRKVRVPFVLMAGAVAKLKLVPDVSVNVHD